MRSLRLICRNRIDFIILIGCHNQIRKFGKRQVAIIYPFSTAGGKRTVWLEKNYTVIGADKIPIVKERVERFNLRFGKGSAVFGISFAGANSDFGF